METQIFEGTFSEVQRQLNALPLKPEARLRVIVTETDTLTTAPVEPFVPTEYRNGLPLLPRRNLPEPITTELVRRLSEDDDQEVLRAYRTAGR